MTFPTPRDAALEESDMNNAGEGAEVHATTRFPMRRAGGPFLIFMGAAMLLGVGLRGNQVMSLGAFLAGVVPAIGFLLLARRLSPATPAPAQARALMAAIALEIVLFVALGAVVDPAAAPRSWWLCACLIVGIHFVPMVRAFGPPMLVLGALCSGYAALGLLMPGVPFAALGLLDGLTKLAIGGWMLRSVSSPAIRVSRASTADRAPRDGTA